MDRLRNEMRMMTRTARMDQTLTLAKSLSAISTRSFVMALSPVTRPSGSAALTRAIICSTCAFTASEPAL